MRAALQTEMEALITAESNIDEELQMFFQSLSQFDFTVDGADGSNSASSAGSSAADAMRDAAGKIASFSPHFEGMVQNAKKLALQVNECHLLSDRVSVMVRRLDMMQIRSQQALACTEDVLNLKTLRTQLTDAIRDRDLASAVRSLQQVHKISPEAASTSEDYVHISKLEKEVQGMVQADFATAISANNIADVMALCPLLQTLGLETVARDQFLDFVGEHVFIAVTADGAAAGDARDAATGYAQALSSLFNSAYLILQKYLPMVLQGMENSYGDVMFLQRLHARCEREAGTVLKRYLAYRDVRSIIAHIQKGGNSSMAGNISRVGTSLGIPSSSVLSSRGDGQAPTEQQVHIVLDELALLIQYCTLYSRYIKQLTTGSQKRVRSNPVHVDSNSKQIAAESSSLLQASAPSGGDKKTAGHVDNAAATIFPGPVSFDKMIEEFVSRYYMEAEHWIMQKSLRSLSIFQATGTDTSNASEGLDECFYVLQRCGLRAVATNSIHAACAVMHYISDLLSAELLGKVSAALAAASEKVSIALLAHISKLVQQTRRSTRSLAGYDAESESNVDSSDGLTGFDQLDRTFLSGYRNVIAMASTIGGSSTSAANSIQDSEYSAKILTYMNRGANSAVIGGNDSSGSDPYGVEGSLEVFNLAEKCGRYAARLGKEVVASAEAVFGAASSGSSNTSGKGQVGSEAEMLVLCKEDYSAAHAGFSNALNAQFGRLADSCKNLIKDLLQQILGSKGPLGGVRFDLSEETFDQQAALVLLPTAVVTPIETLIEICTGNLSETNKDVLLGLLADACCDRIEQFILQTGFRFAGALKFEECVRAIMSVFVRASTTSIRNRFSRLREVLMVLTSDVKNAGFADSLAQISAAEAQTILSLRRDQ